MLRRRHLLAGLWPLPAWGQATPEPTLPAPLFDGMGPYRVTDASTNALARRYMSQGMVLAWGFNPAEAARSFAGALQHDAHCAAACWGLAWALGPTINTDMADADAARVGTALQRALALAPRATPRWRALITALVLRHPQPGTSEVDEDRYARRLRALVRQFPNDADVAMLAAEALMNLHPYDWWQPDGRPQPWTGEVTQQLRRALALDPLHPGANHLWVHLFEQSSEPRRALPEANRLRTLVPGSSHLLHMPAHIDMRLGRYAEATAANQRSITADQRYLQQVDAQRAYRVGYVAHNHHFLWASAAMQGCSQLAIDAAWAAYPAACGSTGDDGSGTLQHYRVLPLYALIRFARWQDILTGTPPPDGAQPYPLAIWHFARGTALVRRGRLAEARTELERLVRLAADPALARARVKQVNPASALLQIALHTLRADLAQADGRTADALAGLRQAVAVEDGLQHDEPHLWLAPTRHALAAALLSARQWVEASRVLRQDLAHYPDNGWALSGLLQAQQATGQGAVARHTAARLKLAWRDADVALNGPRLS
jgi:tetratricopeptide (TPR) repeat protein